MLLVLPCLVVDKRELCAAGCVGEPLLSVVSLLDDFSTSMISYFVLNREEGLRLGLRIPRGF